MDDATKEVANGIVDALKDDPCLLTIVIILGVCFGILWLTYRHQEKMQDKLFSQFATAKGGK